MYEPLALSLRAPRTSRSMRRWRYEHQGNLWTKGGRGRCFGRFFCCTIMIFVFLLVSIILSLALVCPSIQCICWFSLNSNGTVDSTAWHRNRWYHPGNVRQYCTLIYRHPDIPSSWRKYIVPTAKRRSVIQRGNQYHVCATSVFSIFRGYDLTGRWCSVNNPNYFSVKFDSINADVGPSVNLFYDLSHRVF